MPSATSKRRSGSGKVTINHDEIRRWVEERGGRPACVKGTERGDSCLLRIDYPGFSGEGRLEPMEWEDFFDTFDQNNLAFVYQESKNGNPSRFSKLVDRGNVKAPRSSSRGGSTSQRGGRGSSGGRSSSRSGGGRAGPRNHRGKKTGGGGNAGAA